MFEFYVYVYLNPLKCGNFLYGSFKFKYEPFYVGKGKGKRNVFHTQVSDKRNLLKQRILNKIKTKSRKPIIIKLYENLSEASAFRLEKCLIKMIGRRDLKLGTLANLTDGGEGGSGIIYTRKRRESMIIEKRPIVKYNNKGKVVEIFENIVDLSIKYPKILTNHLHRSCKSSGHRKIDDHFWKYYEGEKLNDVLELNDEFKPILQYDLIGNLIAKWNRVNELHNLGYSSGAILKCCRNNEKKCHYYKFKNSMWFFDDNSVSLKIKPYVDNMATGSCIIKKETIKMFTLEGKFIGIYTPKELKLQNYQTKAIYMCCNKKLKTTQGYLWEWS